MKAIIITYLSRATNYWSNISRQNNCE